MPRLGELWLANQDFLELGGNVVVVILATTFVMWTLILERSWYLRTAHRREVAEVLEAWRRRAEHHSWHAHQIRRAMISRVSLDMRRSIPMIKTLVALCPLFGLLGTVTGMVEVFNVIAEAGYANPRAMASGVSRATIPTMAGMVAALSGYIPSVLLERRASAEIRRVTDALSPAEG